MNLQRLFSYSLGLALLTLPSLRAQEDAPTITVRKSDQVSVALAALGGPGGGAATKTLRDAFALMGSVDVVEEARGAFVIRGSASGDSLSGEVVDRSGSLVLAKTYRGAGRSAAHQFADDVVLTLTGKPGIAHTRLAFAATRTGNKEIFLSDFDGANVVQLTRDNSISVGPKISADGRLLLYTGYQSGYADIYRVEIASGARGRIVKFPGTNSGGVLSPDGRRMAMTMSKDGNPELYVANSNGGGSKRLTRTRGVEASPTWSPDGSEIIYTSDDSGRPQLFRIPASGGSPRLVPTGQGYCTEPSWSPDGTKIAFSVRGGGGFQVAVHDLIRGGTRVVTSGTSAETPAWGADSRHLVYSQGGALMLLDTQGGKSTRIVSGLGKISEPSWSWSR